MERDEFRAGDVAPASGTYVQLNVLWRANRDGNCPGCGRDVSGHAEGLHLKRLLAHAASELRDRAAYYRQMAGAASTAQIRDELLKLAQRFDLSADQGEERD